MDTKFIHLLYVPTMACNMACKYCYLEDNTKELESKYDALETLKFAVNKFKESNVIPFNISLHGGEVTTLNEKTFHDIIKFISDYYSDNREVITNAGFKVGRPHIKTNLYNIDKHIDTIKEFNVSISGSLDLPLSLHREYRVTKDGKDTLDKIFANIKLLENIDNKKKVSATIFKEHYDHIDEIIEDMKYLHKNTCLDMNDFNFMIGFDYNSNSMLHHITEEEQVEFYKRMHKEFDGTELDKGVNGPRFDEFGPGYCSNCENCGEKFFLLERNGDIYSCVRGQKNPNFYYGNIYNDDVEKILNTAKYKIFMNHNRTKFNDDCAKCGYLYVCKTGCPFVKNVYDIDKSYTCLLQQQMYKDRNIEVDCNNEDTVYDYFTKMRTGDISKYIPKTNNVNGDPTLEQIIESDPKLKYIYDDDVFILEKGKEEYKLSSQITKKSRDIIYIAPNERVLLHMKKNMIEEEADYPENNALFIIILSGNMVTYGDEGRTKQRHVASLQIYKGVLDSKKEVKEGYYTYDITDTLKEYKDNYSTDTPNNIFFTTSALRDYHYLKQKNNAYYHIQAINLPFQNIEFYYLEELIK